MSKSSGRRNGPWLTLGIGSCGLPFEQTTARASHNRTGAETACASERSMAFTRAPLPRPPSRIGADLTHPALGLVDADAQLGRHNGHQDG